MMKRDDYFAFQDAVKLLREDKQKEMHALMKEIGRIGGASYRLFTNYSFTGLPDTKQIGDSTIDDLYETIKGYAISKEQLEPYLIISREKREESRLSKEERTVK